MLRVALALALASALSVGAWRGVVWLREDAVKDFMLEAAIAAAEARAANQETKDRITGEIQNETIDELRARAAAGGMFSEPAAD